MRKAEEKGSLLAHLLSDGHCTQILTCALDDGLPSLIFIDRPRDSPFLLLVYDPGERQDAWTPVAHEAVLWKNYMSEVLGE